MIPRKFFLLLVASGIAVALWLLRPESNVEAVAGKIPLATISSPATPPSPDRPEIAASRPAETNILSAADVPVSAAADLNASFSTIASDLEMLNALFTNWRLDFPHGGNPIGDNAEITAALTGDNPLRLPLIPRNHRAINAAGELCDRWGTPFRFHSLSSERMELRSAGPDKKFGTEDDSLLTPP